MNEDPGGGDGEESPRYFRLPLPIVAGGLLGFVVLVLAVGLYANRNLRPQPGLVATPVVAVAAATPLATVAAAQPTLATATPFAVPTATAVAATVVAASATAPPSPTARPTVSPELAAEIGDAYQQYWQVRAEALYDLDASRLQEVMAGDHLTAAEDLISQLRSEGRAILTDVTHNYVVFEASQSDAGIVDEYADESVYIDLPSHQRITQPVGTKVKEQYQLNRIEGTWKVVSLIRGS